MEILVFAGVFWILATWIAGLILYVLERTGIKTVVPYEPRGIHPRWRRGPLRYLGISLFLLTTGLSLVAAAPALLPVLLFNRWRRSNSLGQ